MIRVTERAMRGLRGHAARAYPNEACGVLAGSVDGPDKIVLAALPIENRAASSTRFRMSPSDFQRAEAHAEQLGRTLVGIYHSHPDHTAFASERDRNEALPFFSYVIVSVVTAEPVETRSFVLSDDRSRFVEEPIELLEPDATQRRGVMSCP